jgi:hypothetical protein
VPVMRDRVPGHGRVSLKPDRLSIDKTIVRSEWETAVMFQMTGEAPDEVFRGVVKLLYLRTKALILPMSRVRSIRVADQAVDQADVEARKRDDNISAKDGYHDKLAARVHKCSAKQHHNVKR